MKIQFLPLWVVLAFLSFLSLGKEAKAISLNLVPSSQTALIGDTVNINVNISDLGNNTAPSVSTFDFDVSFDQSVLSYAGTTFGDPTLGDLVDQSGLSSLFTQLSIFEAVGAVNSAPGTINFFELSLDLPAILDSNQPDAFTLATLNFSAIDTGTSFLNLTSLNALGDSFGNPLVLASSGSTFIEVIQAPSASVSEPSAGLLSLAFASGLGVLLMRKDRQGSTA